MKSHCDQCGEEAVYHLCAQCSKELSEMLIAAEPVHPQIWCRACERWFPSNDCYITFSPGYFAGIICPHCNAMWDISIEYKEEEYEWELK